jgi:hypothetical protein
VAIYPQANQGAHASLTRCLALARGDLIFILNSDDAYEPDRLRHLVELFQRDSDLALATSWIRIIDGQGAELGIKEGFHNLPPWPRPASGPGLADTGDPELALLESNYISTTSNIAFRRSLLAAQELEFLPLRYCHDWDFILAATAEGSLALVEKPLVRYRVHEKNTIAEGQQNLGPDLGAGLMRFEILWVIARHAMRLWRKKLWHQATTPPSDGEVADLRNRLWNSMPHFGQPSLLAQLITLRGGEDTPPTTYSDLLRPGHPLREAAVRSLADA